MPRREIQGSFEERMDLEGDLILKEMEMEKIHSREAESSVRGESAAEVPLEDGDGTWKLSLRGAKVLCIRTVILVENLQRPREL